MYVRICCLIYTQKCSLTQYNGNFLEVKPGHTSHALTRGDLCGPRPLLNHSPLLNSYDYNVIIIKRLISILTLAYSPVCSEMETRSEELARVQRERRKTTEGVSECEGRCGREKEIKGAYIYLLCTWWET